MAKVDYYLKIDGVAGESADAKHKGEIEIESWSWGETNSPNVDTNGGLSAGKVSLQDVHFTAKVHKGSPLLKLKCASGEHIKKATLTCRKAGTEQQEYLLFNFEDLLISSYQLGGSAHSDIVPVEQVSFAFSTIEMEYKEQDEKGKLKGPVKAGWHLAKNIKK